MSRSVFLVAFDFDHTIVDDNTDTVVRKLLPPGKLFDGAENIYRKNGWIAYMSKVFELLHSNSIGMKEIESAIVNIPAVQGIEILLKELHSRCCETIIISDSNTTFIDAWLKNKKLDHVVTEVFTNPAKVCDGKIIVDMYHVQDSCKLCSKNLCKGRILQSYIEKRSNEGVSFDKIVYVGDGKNDFCPSLRLSENDFVFPRRDYVLIKLLNDNKNKPTPPPKAEIIPWSNGFDILRELNDRLGFLQKDI